MGRIKDVIAKNIQAFRKEKQLSQSALAKQVGVYGSAVSNWENGANSMDVETLYKVSQALDVTPNCLFGMEEQGWLSPDEQKLLGYYRELDEAGRKELLKSAVAIRNEKDIDLLLERLGRQHKAIAFNGETARYSITDEDQKEIDEILRRMGKIN